MVVLTALAATMVVNALVTGLIVFKILRVFLEVKTSVEQTLGSLSSTGGPKLQRIMFIIIEFGMALFAIKLGCIVISSLIELQGAQAQTPLSIINAQNVITTIHQALNVIFVQFLLILFY